MGCSIMEGHLGRSAWVSTTTHADRQEMGNEKLEKVKATKARMHAAIVRAVEAKLATATLYGMTDAEAALRQCLQSLTSSMEAQS